MKKLLILFAFAIMNIASNYAQNSTVELDVNGIIIGTNYTDSQVRTQLGQPTRYYNRQSENGDSREYQYGPDSNYDFFVFDSTSGIITGFATSSSTFKLFKGQLKIGDNISRLSQLGLGVPKYQGNGTHKLEWKDGILIFSVNSSNTIKGITYIAAV